MKLKLQKYYDVKGSVLKLITVNFIKFAFTGRKVTEYIFSTRKGKKVKITNIDLIKEVSK